VGAKCRIFNTEADDTSSNQSALKV